jgi:hypothetical protein
LRNRWGMLAILFHARLTMSLQFQSVGAVAPLLGRNSGMSLADIGLLIGVYFTPGVALALAGGGLGRRRPREMDRQRRHGSISLSPPCSPVRCCCGRSTAWVHKAADLSKQLHG